MEKEKKDLLSNVNLENKTRKSEKKTKEQKALLGFHFQLKNLSKKESFFNEEKHQIKYIPRQALLLHTLTPLSMPQFLKVQ